MVTKRNLCVCSWIVLQLSQEYDPRNHTKTHESENHVPLVRMNSRRIRVFRQRSLPGEVIDNFRRRLLADKRREFVNAGL